jgi:hypothetical protein
MPFLPVKSRYYVEEPAPFSLVLNNERLECVNDFKYLGFVLISFPTSKAHMSQQRDAMFNAAQAMGELLRRLEIANVKSIRSYFHSSVSSQLYGLESFNFQVDIYYRAAKLFLISTTGRLSYFCRQFSVFLTLIQLT